MARTPTKFEHRLKEDMSIDQNANSIPLPPNNRQSLKDELPRVRKVKQSALVYDVDFDALLSSSPLAQSTPRIRLEPTFEEDGKKKRKNVPADSRSLFDPDNSSVGQHSDMYVDSPSRSKAPSRRVSNTVKRRNSQIKDGGLGIKSHLSKRMKKHPSPSKAELEGLEIAMRQYPPFVRGASPNVQNDLTLSFGELRTAISVLTPKDHNAMLQEPTKRQIKGKGLEIFEKPGSTKQTSSMSEMPKRPKAQKSSMIPKPADPTNTKPRTKTSGSSRYDLADGSMMDIDELQWDRTAYDIGMRRI
jgi:hypothetical protein